jgi:hypothetical protein
MKRLHQIRIVLVALFALDETPVRCARRRLPSPTPTADRAGCSRPSQAPTTAGGGAFPGLLSQMRNKPNLKTHENEDQT